MDEVLQVRRIGVIGDIHAEDELLHSALKFLSSADVDLVMTVGDITDGPGSVDRCCSLLREHGVAAVSGNHERLFLAGEARDLPNATLPGRVSRETRLYLGSLPRTLAFETGAGRLLLCHGLGERDMAGVRPGDDGRAIESNAALSKLLLDGEYRFVVNGHTHQRMVRSFDQLTIINAGTLFRKDNPCFAVVNFNEGHVQYYVLGKAGEVSEAEMYQLPGHAG